MTRVYLGLGSNIAPEKNLAMAVQELRASYGELELSAVYRNAPIGFDGDDFLNLVVGFDTDDSPQAICRQIDRIHDIAGRQRGHDQWASRPLDVDLLLYDSLVCDERPVHVPREDILEYSFVLRPLAELAPDFKHPVTGKRLAEHWREFDHSGHPLNEVPLVL